MREGGYRETQRRTYYVLSVVGTSHCVFAREGKEVIMETETLHPNQKPTPEANPALPSLGKLLSGQRGHTLVADPQRPGYEDRMA